MTKLVSLIQNIMALFEKIPASLVQLLLRVSIAHVFWASGETKVDGWTIKDSTYTLFENDYKVPLIPPHAAAVMSTIA